MQTATAEPAPTRADLLASELARFERQQPGFWDFSHSRGRQGGHAFFQYPAMMVPELQGTLLDALLLTAPDTKLVYDPFLGSGTVLLEALYRGLSFFGADINPMATLLSRVKAEPPQGAEASAAVTRVVDRAKRLQRGNVHTFANSDKWFTDDVAHELSRLRRSIVIEDDAVTRRFLWVCLAETVRLVSNSRTSTFKLHVYSAEDMSKRKPQALEMFTAIGEANATRAAEHWQMLRQPHGSSSVSIIRGSVLDEATIPLRADALMTSPPYGDNETTVPYGQHSYLPLQWIAPEDLGDDFDPDLLRSTHRLDTASLGGSIRHALEPNERERLTTLSPALRAFLAGIEASPPLLKKVLAFTRDYERALRRATAPLKHGGFSFWTLGQRRVGGLTLPLVQMTAEFLAVSGHTEVTTITRQLPRSRRMPVRNKLGATMATEHVLVMVKR